MPPEARYRQTPERHACPWPPATSRPRSRLVDLVEHALDIDNVFLVPWIEQQLAAAARPRQIDVDDLADAAGRFRHHHDLVREENRFVDRMRDEQHRFAIT